MSYIFSRKHIKRLWAGDKHFLPLKFHNPASSASVVSLPRSLSDLRLSHMPKPEGERDTRLTGLVGELPMRKGCWAHMAEVMKFSSCSETSFFPLKPQVAIARYSGWQIAYILWGKCRYVTHPIQHTWLHHLGSPGCEWGGERWSEAALASALEGPSGQKGKHSL